MICANNFLCHQIVFLSLLEFSVCDLTIGKLIFRGAMVMKHDFAEHFQDFQIRMFIDDFITPIKSFVSY